MTAIVNSSCWIWESVLSPEFCRSALEQVDWAVAEDGLVGGKTDYIVDTEKRRTDVIWQNFMQPLGCVARTYIESANNQAEWGFILNGQEDTQISRYKSSDQGHYDWHMDSSPPKNGIQRKLTCVILLNDASEFEGGELQFRLNEGENMLAKQGSIIVFPSFMEHKVTPVTKGVRYTAVTWANGPSFR